MKKPANRIHTAAALALPPVITIVFMLFVYAKNDMFPFGGRSLSWCDMSQQVLPLLNQLKDILDGKGGIFYSLKNSGGMNFYGVFFFFIASPFSLLVKFVDKADMMTFANILVMLKMSVCALTAACYFRFCRKKLDLPCTVLLSVMYPFCGYTMMYYQNVIWLDMMYLFPLLLISLTRITKKQKSLMYIVVVSAMAVVNYYITYMVVIFILLFTGLYILKNHKSEYCSRISREIFSGSLIAALLTAVVWLPSLMQYLSSGRGETTLLESLSGGNLVTSYTTMLPMLFCTAFCAVVVAADVMSGRRRSVRNNRMLILLALTLIPFFIEPINKMWHTGNYMSFPGRFGFMTIFLALVCTAYALEQQVEGNITMTKYLIGGVSGIAVMILGFVYISALRRDRLEEMSKYSRTLWGDETSFKLLAGVFIMLIIGYGCLYAVYKKGFVYKNIFVGLCAILFLFESYSYTEIYMAAPAVNNEKANVSQSEVYDLSGRIEDEDFYRAKSYSKVYNNNLIGALGYNSISHYTSLNDRSYMFSMKRLGYSGVWMETSSVGGTRLTDALLSVKYEINGGVGGSKKIYMSKAGFIEQLPDYLPMGLLLEKNSLEGSEELPEELTRTEAQSAVSQAVFGEDIVTPHQPHQTVSVSDGRYIIHSGESYYFTVTAQEETAIYFDCFDELTNHLSEPIFEAFSITVNGSSTISKYPTSTNNGVLYLGTFKNEEVNIAVNCKKDITCRSFGLFSIDCARLSELCEAAEGVGFSEEGSGILSGSCTLNSSRTCFVSLPYMQGYTVKVNGEEVKYQRALSGFISFDLQSGENDIVISFVPQGFKAGVMLSLVGAALLIVTLKLRKRLDEPLKGDTAVKYLMLGVSALVFAAVYILPLVVYVMAASSGQG